MADPDALINLASIPQIVIGVTAPLLFVFFFRSRGNFETNGEAVWSCFLIGMASVFFLALVILLDPLIEPIEPAPLRFAVEAFAQAAIPEEVVKLVIVLLFVVRHHAHETLHDTVVMAVAVAAGFSALENVFYFMAVEHWPEVAIGRSLLSSPSHIFSAATMGALLALMRAAGKSNAYLPLILAPPIVMHGLYNYFLSMNEALQDGTLSGTPLLNGLVTAGFLGINLVNITVSLHLSRKLLLKDAGFKRRFALPGAAILQSWQRAKVTQALFWSSLGLVLVGFGLMVPVLKRFASDDVQSSQLIYAFVILCVAHGIMFLAEVPAFKRPLMRKLSETAS